MSDRKKILITGGAGFIGAALTRKLLLKGFEPHLFLRKSTNLWRIKDLLSQINFYNVDLLDKLKVEKTVKKINPFAIFHLATYSSYRDQSKYEKIIQTNIKGTLNLLSTSKDISYELFVNTGSSSEYGIKNFPMKEDDSLEPISFYAAAKAGATYICKVFALEFNKPIVTLRPFSVYGPYEADDRLIPTVIKALINNETIKLTDGNKRRDFVYIDDVVDAYIKSLEKKSKISGQVLNIGTGVEYTNEEIVKILFKVSGKKARIEKGAFPKRLWDNPHWVSDTSLTKRVMGWESKTSLQEGLKKTYEWFEKNQIQY